MQVVEWDEMIVAGMSVHAEWNRLWEEVPKAWARLFDRAPVLDGLSVGPFVDVCLGVVDSAYLQLVGVSLRDPARIPDGFTAVRIPDQRLLHHRHIGPVTGIAESFGEMYAWAEQQALKLGEFKLDFGYTPEGGETEHDLYVGLLPGMHWHYLDAA